MGRLVGRTFVLYGLFLLPGSASVGLRAESDRPWLDDAARRLDGLLFRLRRDVQRPAADPVLRDERGEIYRLQDSEIVYSPGDDNWSPAVPSTAEAPLFLARARGLLKAGAVEPALEILLALQTMDGRFFPVSASARKTAVTASVLIEKLSRRRPDLEPMANRLDPFCLFDSAQNETWVISEPASFRVALPGRFRVRRGKSYPTSGPDSPGNRILHLTDGTSFLMISLDVWPLSNRRLRRDEYLEIMDFRRGLDRTRRETTGFKRTCTGEICHTAMSERGKVREWTEGVKTREGSAFFFSVFPSNDAMMLSILNRVAGMK